MVGAEMRKNSISKQYVFKEGKITNPINQISNGSKMNSTLKYSKYSILKLKLILKPNKLNNTLTGPALIAASISA